MRSTVYRTLCAGAATMDLFSSRSQTMTCGLARRTREDSENIRFDQKFFVPRSLASERQKAFRRWYEEKASERILPRVRQTAKALGVALNDGKIVDSRFRWGSCTPQDNVTFNWRLIKAPVFVIDYVIAHELAHLIEANHTPRFWNIVKAQVPGMEKAKAWLKEHGQFLEQDL